jgi:carboxyl-terminal processing protease
VESGLSRRRVLPRPSRLTLRAGVLALVVFVAGVASDRAGLLPGAPALDPHPGDPNVALIDQAWDLLHEKYIDASTLDSKKLAYGAIAGMAQAVGDDGHTDFLTPDEVKASQAALSGSYVGIGAEMDTTGDEPVVVGVFRESPADRAGLRRGDVITEVDGKPTKGTPLDTVVGTIRGPAGTAVSLTVRREGTAAALTFRIVRAEVKTPAVHWAMVPGTTSADIRIEQFSTGAADAFKKALGDAMGAGATGVILDLRENPGGYVNEAIGVASQFLTGGDVYLSRDATGKRTPSAVTSGGIAPKIPLVVLVDHGTASAAEIVTGALQDAGRATVVGATTFGTGTVLGKFDLADGSALRIGTVEWLTPKGRRIWHEGLTPDVAIALSNDVQRVAPDDLAALGAAGLAKSADAQLRKAIELLGGPAAG